MACNGKDSSVFLDNRARRAHRLARQAESYPHAEAMERLGTESAFVVLARAKALEAEGKPMVHLEIGEPDFDTPQHIIDAGKEALDKGMTHYTNAAGTIEFRDAICRHVKKTRNVDVTRDNVVVTPGAKPIIFFSILCTVEKGDEVIYPNPGFPIYESMIRFTGATPVPLQLHQESNFRFSESEIRSLVTPRTKLIIVNSPHNPTGGILTSTELGWIAAIAKENNLLVLSDEIYDEIVYSDDGNPTSKRHESILSIPGMKEHTILLAGHSKNYAMTGWRLGYGVMPPCIAKYVTQLMINCNSCAAAFTQYAGQAALEGPTEPTEKMVAAWKERRDVMVERLNAMGLKTNLPGGAFYIFPSVQSLGIPSSAVAKYLLERAGVAVLDGGCFGEFGQGFIRLSCANSLENINTALDRVEIAVKEIKAGCVPDSFLPTPRPALHDANADWRVACSGDDKDGQTILVTKNLPGKTWLQGLESAGFTVVVGTSDDILSQDQLIAALRRYRPVGVIGQLTEKWNETLFQELKSVGGKVYSNYAVGFDNVDVAAAVAQGIHVGNTPGVLTETTAELALTLTFAAARRVAEGDTLMRDGGFHGWLPELYIGRQLHRSTVGILGAGRIGAAYARMMCEGHKCNVIYQDIFPNPKLEEFVTKYSAFLESVGETGVSCRRVDTVEEVLREADVVSIHTVLDSTTRHLINAERLALMKPDAVLVNSARGPIIDEAALVAHLKTFPSFRVGMDVYEKEPQTTMGLDLLPNATLLPHLGSATEYTRAGMAAIAAANVRGVVREHPMWSKASFYPFADEAKLPEFVGNLVSAQKLPYGQ